MKLLLDENLSRRIVPFLQTAFPGSTQVALLELDGSHADSFYPALLRADHPARG